MKVLLQPKGSQLCGAYCIAMITKEDPETIIKRLAHPKATNVIEVIFVLRAFGFSCPIWKLRKVPKELPYLCILNYTYPGRKMGHWVVKRGRNVYDPGFGKYRYNKEVIEALFDCKVNSYLEIEEGDI